MVHQDHQAKSDCKFLLTIYQELTELPKPQRNIQSHEYRKSYDSLFRRFEKTFNIYVCECFFR